MKQYAVKEFLLFEAPGYNDIVRRGYEINLRNDDINKLEDLVKRKEHLGLAKIRPSDLTRIKPDALLPSLVPDSKVDIPGGWRNKRHKVLLRIQHKGIGNTVIETVIQGYTDIPVSVRSGTINPETRIYLNSIIEISKSLDPTTGRLISNIMGHFEVLHDPIGNTMTIRNQLTGSVRRGNYNTGIVLARPEDVLTTILSNRMVNSDSMRSYSETTLAIPTTADKKFSNPIKYMSETLSSLVESKTTMDSFGGDVSDILDNATNRVASPELVDIEVMKEFAKMNDYTILPYITVRQIEMLDRRASAQVISLDKAISMAPSDPRLSKEKGEYLDIPTVEAQLAQLLAEALTGYMADFLLERATLYMTNIPEHGVGRPEPFVSILPPEASSALIHHTLPIPLVEGLDAYKQFNKMATVIESELMPVITSNNERIVEIRVDSTLFGDTFIEISVDGKEFVPFRIPQFASSLFSGMIMPTDKYRVLSHEFDKLTTAITLD